MAAEKKGLLGFFSRDRKGYYDDDDDDDEFDDDLFDDDDDDDDDYDYDDDDDDDDDDEDYTPRKTKSFASKPTPVKQTSSRFDRQESAYTNKGQVRPANRNNLVEFNGRKGLKSDMNGSVVVIQPHDIEDTDRIVDELLDGSAVILNLEGVEVTTAQRIVDFVGGATKAINGSIDGINGSIFIATSHNGSVTGDLRPEISSQGNPNQLDVNY